MTGMAKPMPMLPLCEPVPEEPSGGDRGVDADELAAGVDQRAAAVAGVDRGAGLDRVGHDRLTLLLALAERVLLLAVLRVVVTGRFSALTMPVVTVPARPSGLPTAITGSPTLSVSASPARIGGEVGGGVVELDDGQVGGGVGADHAGAVGATVVERHRELGLAAGPGDDVVVGHDVALVVDDDAGPLGAALAALDGDRHDAGGDGAGRGAPVGGLRVGLGDGGRLGDPAGRRGGAGRGVRRDVAVGDGVRRAAGQDRGQGGDGGDLGPPAAARPGRLGGALGGGGPRCGGRLAGRRRAVRGTSRGRGRADGRRLLARWLAVPERLGRLRRLRLLWGVRRGGLRHRG